MLQFCGARLRQPSASARGAAFIRTSSRTDAGERQYGSLCAHLAPDVARKHLHTCSRAGRRQPPRGESSGGYAALLVSAGVPEQVQLQRRRLPRVLQGPLDDQPGCGAWLDCAAPTPWRVVADRSGDGHGRPGRRDPGEAEERVPARSRPLRPVHQGSDGDGGAAGRLALVRQRQGVAHHCVREQGDCAHCVWVGGASDDDARATSTAARRWALR
mmetsp:Transcript_106653/g.301682  ORF Transcript_106653/g.301682 Transcript_106653/m.301682 type:complete len:215 (-) Transcript_106653:538-1182(-)